jgi:hypothetical protein
MPVPPDWIEHRRGDGELLGWMRVAGAADGSDGFVVIDLLGRERNDLTRGRAVDWLDAEAALDRLGIGYLADPYELLLDDGRWLRVRITEVSTERVRVTRDDWGAIDVPAVGYTLGFPAPAELRTLDPFAPRVPPGV